MNNRLMTTPRVRRLSLAGAAIIGALAVVAPAHATTIPRPLPLPTLPVPTALPTLTPPGGAPMPATPSLPTLGAPGTQVAPINGGTGGGNCLQNGGTGRTQEVQTAILSGLTETPPGTQAVGGVYAKILNYNPYVVPEVGPASGPDADTAWTMVTTQNYPFWFQVGWLKWPSMFSVTGSGPQIFIQDKEPTDGTNAPFTNIYGVATTGSATYYTTSFNPFTGTDSSGNPTLGEFKAYVNGTTSLTSPRNAYFTPDTGQMAGEIHDTLSQFPGGTQTPETFVDGHIWFPAGYIGSNAGSWQWYSGELVNYNPTIVGTSPSAVPGSSTPTIVDYSKGQTLSEWDKNCTQ